ncbi:hypothetical protein MOQ_010262 [Trypanosoma cruzi marinkellei]|uniref:Uncharacterized protein n=1 Tax=Trypanosoma cruzi marinkellei TaxID=85056 RepID=K2MUN2_TRYCR|nr:hypothetical protein MOQ_010262 [Trypanosoma cruzi marinkellei]
MAKKGDSEVMTSMETINDNDGAEGPAMPLPDAAGKHHPPRRFPRVDAMELEAPVALVNFPSARQRGGGGGEAPLDVIERGGRPGVPFDNCSLSTVGGSGEVSSHRRRKKYTTTTVTTTTITKILLPHMQQTVVFEGADGDAKQNALDPQAVLMAIEGNKKMSAQNPTEMQSTEGTKSCNGTGHTREQGSPSYGDEAPASRPIHAMRTHRLSQKPSNQGYNGISSSSKKTNNGGINKIILPKIESFTAHQGAPANLTPHEDSSSKHLQTAKGYTTVPQQPWICSQKTVGNTTVTHHQLSALRMPQSGNHNGPSYGGTARESTEQSISNNDGYFPLPQHSPRPRSGAPHTHNNAQLSGHGAEMPWILNEERQENGWHTAG